MKRNDTLYNYIIGGQEKESENEGLEILAISKTSICTMIIL